MRLDYELSHLFRVAWTAFAREYNFAYSQPVLKIYILISTCGPFYSICVEAFAFVAQLQP